MGGGEPGETRGSGTRRSRRGGTRQRDGERERERERESLVKRGVVGRVDLVAAVHVAGAQELGRPPPQQLRLVRAAAREFDFILVYK